MATLYYNAAVDNDWSNVNNWWTDAAFTSQASALPASGDSAVATFNIDTNSGSEPTVANLTCNSFLQIPVTVTGMATFAGAAYATYSATITGNATFTGSASNGGVVTGDAAFADGSNGGTVTGNATFGSGYNSGTVSGNATFGSGGYNSGTVTGNATFGSGSNSGTVSGNATFNDNTSSLNGATVGLDATFNDYANNYGTVTGNATFNDYAYNSGTLGSVSNTFNDSSYNNADLSGVAASVSITGTPVDVSSALAGTLIFSRVSPWPPLRGINGSSILGVI